ncbi:LuxR C-terminal-related transcriptional regulator [Leptolyngbya boryana CZ1]|uniref:LuxR C-terminal-related transcriptional regulator n=1 Tax=Leptolyngbya boryana CZ1 TaxID=3060204 RepID=A0AA96WW31_LEPBY|nr:LuxR C-terminal-related transcriptional regulator [Leptolyngbya boryana]WNZ46363.1 LuxR C-terminal-related transcriptional regulator [Leptolyngbya boryana CZ1]
MPQLPSIADSARILLDLQQINEIAQTLSGCLTPEEIARTVTTGLIDRFDFAMARLWLLDTDQAMLRLVASSGLHTRTDGRFARVPLGAYKVGKIAQNRIAFLSNNLPAESWVGDRDWAIDNRIQGFAGYPLVAHDLVIGVLAMFSRHVLAPEFLEVLQTLCTIVTISLDTAIQYQQTQHSQLISTSQASELMLSEQLVTVLKTARLMLVGTERSLAPSIVYGFLKAAEVLSTVDCSYGRLIYSESAVSLEATVPTARIPEPDAVRWLAASFDRIFPTSKHRDIQTQLSSDQKLLQIVLSVPYTSIVSPSILSEREVEILTLLTQGHRDRDVAEHLIISESTVKFHINNVLSKLQAKTRYQAIYQAITLGWL